MNKMVLLSILLVFVSLRACPQSSVIQQAGECSINALNNKDSTVSLTCDKVDPAIANKVQAILNGTRHNNVALKNLSDKLSMIYEQIQVNQNKGLKVVFVTQIVNMNREAKGEQYFYGYLSHYGSGQQLSPVALLTFVRMSNLYAHEITVNSYSVSIYTHDCGWTYLSRLDSRGGQLVYLPPGPQIEEDASVIDIGVGLDSKLTEPFAAFAEKSGIFMFATKEDCKVRIGDTIKLRLDAEDSTGFTTKFESDNLLVFDDTDKIGSTTNSTGELSLGLTGLIYDVGRVLRRNYTDPVGGVMDFDELALHKARTIVFSRSQESFINYPEGTYAGRRDAPH